MGEGERKRKTSPSKGLENDTIVRRGDESEACSAEYQHNAVGRKADSHFAPAAVMEIDGSSKHFNMH